MPSQQENDNLNFEQSRELESRYTQNAQGFEGTHVIQSQRRQSNAKLSLFY